MKQSFKLSINGPLSESCAYWVDAHCHLSFYANEKLQKAHSEEARELGVRTLIQGGYSPQDGKEQQRILKQMDVSRRGVEIIPCWGVHPWLCQQYSQKELVDLVEQLNEMPSNALVGELGLDFSRTQSAVAKEIQCEIFRKQLGLARRLKRPVVLHVVRAHGLALEILREEGNVWRGWVHGFNGTLEVARRYRKMGLFVSIGPQVLNESNQRLPLAIEGLGLGDIVIESDWPRAPGTEEVKAGLILEVAKKVANIMKVELDELQRHTTMNALDGLGRVGN